MPKTHRALGTLLVLLGALIALKLGFSTISGINQPIRLVLSALLFFATAYAFMRLTNRLWGKNLFGPGRS